MSHFLFYYKIYVIKVFYYDSINTRNIFILIFYSSLKDNTVVSVNFLRISFYINLIFIHD